METRIQTALVRQIQRQMRNQERHENRMFHFELRKRAERLSVVHDHFDALEADTRRIFDSFKTAIDRAIKLNKDRFDIAMTYAIDTPVYDVKKYSFDSDGFEKEAARIISSSNDVLFFKSLYSYSDRPRPDSNNDAFYMVVGVLLLLNCFQYHG